MGECSRPGTSTWKGPEAVESLDRSIGETWLTHFLGATSFCPLKEHSVLLPRRKGKGEHSSVFCGNCLRGEQGPRVSTLGASGSLTGAGDPDTLVWNHGHGKLVGFGRQLSHTQTQPRSPAWQAAALGGSQCRAPRFSPTSSCASSQLSRRPGQGSPQEQKLPV